MSVIGPEVRDVAHGPSWIITGSRDASLRPSADYAFGPRIDGDLISIIVPDVRARALVERTRIAPRLAISVHEWKTLRTFQLKGDVVDARPADETDQALWDLQLARFAAISQHGSAGAAAIRRRPATVFTVRIDAVFDQNPGPGAGRRIDLASVSSEVRNEQAGAPVAPEPGSLATVPADVRAVLPGITPLTIATCSRSGEPNVTVISQIYPVDETHVALSFQFFNKTVRNVRENPFAQVKCFDHGHLVTYNLDLRFVGQETSGPLFERMEMDLEVVASLSGMTGVFKLRAADVYGVLAVRRNEDEFS
jgi:hypothetical protein